MRITFPERLEIDDRNRLTMQSLCSMVGLGDVSILRSQQRFPLVVVEPQRPFRYFGRTILFFDRYGCPKAVAREVYGQHLVNMQGPYTAERIARQITWLSDNQTRLGQRDEEFQSVLLFAPNTGMFRLGVSKNRYKNIAHVLVPDDTQNYMLIASASYLEELNRSFLVRTQAIQALRQIARDNSDELPA